LQKTLPQGDFQVVIGLDERIAIWLDPKSRTGSSGMVHAGIVAGAWLVPNDW
jgi:hypothetical protein